MGDTKKTTESPIDITKVFEPLEQIIKPRSDDEFSTLQNSLHFLQVYTQWGVRLPTSENDFKDMLNIGVVVAGGKSPSFDDFLFKDTFAAANAAIKEACKKFLEEGLPKLIGVVGDTKDYAERTTNAEMGFARILELLDQDEPSNDDALALLSVFIDLAKDNKSAADKVIEFLSWFRTQILEADVQVVRTIAMVESNDRVNQAKIDHLTANAEDDDSIQHFVNEVEKDQESYEENTKIASTALVYAWVAPPIPFGLIPAIVVATVYGIRADEWLKRRTQAEIDLKKRRAELYTAIAVQRSLKSASHAIQSVDHYTKLAMDNATVLANGWKALIDGLKTIADTLKSTTTTSDGKPVPRKHDLVRVFLEAATKQYGKLLPYLDAMTTAPYIEIVGTDEFQRDVEKIVDEQSGPGKDGNAK